MKIEIHDVFAVCEDAGHSRNASDLNDVQSGQTGTLSALRYTEYTHSAAPAKSITKLYHIFPAIANLFYRNFKDLWRGYMNKNSTLVRSGNFHRKR